MVFYGVVLTREETEQLDGRWRELMEFPWGELKKRILGNFDNQDENPIREYISACEIRVEYGEHMRFEPVVPPFADAQLAQCLERLGLPAREPGWHVATLYG
jgi:hypothetical protein